jgi:ABC-2 type transport system permease protein
MYVGNAFYLFVANILFGISWVIMEDREFFEMIKYIYTSPIRMFLYLFGRGLAKISITTLAVVTTLAFGILLLRLPIHLGRVDWGSLLLALAIGLWGIVSLGMILAAISMLVARHSGYLNEGVSGLFFLLCGAIFPIEVLPSWLRPVSRALPFTYWLEAIRRAVLPGQASLSPSLAGFSNGSIFAILLVTTLLLALASRWIFHLCETTARRKGWIDRRTDY